MNCQSMKERLSQLLKQPVAEVKKLFGDASYRTYWRAQLENGKTFVIMAMPEGRMSVSEEVTNLKEKPDEIPYINVQKYLRSLDLPVPEILLFSEPDRWLVLEDLGDTKLWDVVANAQPSERERWYKKAIDLLINLQNKTFADINTSRMKSPDTLPCIAVLRSFDATLFNWEFDHFWEYYFQLQTSKSKLQKKDEEIFKKETRKITEELCNLPQSFTHRDYQSRNLMVRDDRLTILDFQDALMGPQVYDVVCLLRDSYVDLTPQLDALISYYCEQSGEDLKEFRRAFDLQTVQRKLKDSGRFVFIDRVKKNPNFLPFIPVSMGYVRQALERLPEYSELYALLKKYVEEWQ